MDNLLTPESVNAWITLTIVLLLPLAPAYFLFRALPENQAEVSGPLQGFQIKLGGAFAGYFVILILALSTHNQWNPPPKLQVWELDGQVVNAQGSPVQVLDWGDLSVDPEPMARQKNGNFRLTVATSLSPGGEVLYPAVTVGHKDLQSITIHLNPKQGCKPDDEGVKQCWDVMNKVVQLGKIHLNALPEYATATAVTADPVVE